MSNIEEKLKKGQNLSFEESKILFSELMEGKHDESSIIDILENLLAKGETKNKTIMGLMHKNYNIHGFQFHPESISTKVGMKLIENFIKN